MKFRTNPDRSKETLLQRESAFSKSQKSFDLVIAGGGAAGVLAAIAACDEGLSGTSVAIVEKEETILRKVRASGNGRCNLANMGSIEGRYHGHYPQFVRGVFSRVAPESLLSYFRSIGLATISDDEGRVYPRSNQAQSVVLTLTRALNRRNIEVFTEKQLVRISRESSRFLLDLSDGMSWDTRALVIASGGPASPNLGGDLSGMRLLMSLGHACESPFPALVPLVLHPHPLLKRAEGVRFRGQAFFENCKGTCSKTVSGEFLVTSYGMSGIAAMELGRTVSMIDISDPAYSMPECTAGHQIESRSQERSRSKDTIGNLVVDLLPEFSEEELVSFFNMQDCSRQTSTDLWRIVLSGLIPVKMAEAMLMDSHFPLEPTAVVQMIKSLRLPVIGTRDFDYAQVTAGGISTRDFNPRTLESYKIPRLYAAGEVLDIDGDTGGFNLMWAFSSGILAGLSAARALQKNVGD